MKTKISSLAAGFLLAASACTMPRINMAKRDTLFASCLTRIDCSQSEEDIEHDIDACDYMAQSLATRRNPNGPTLGTSKTGLAPQIEDRGTSLLPEKRASFPVCPQRIK